MEWDPTTGHVFVVRSIDILYPAAIILCRKIRWDHGSRYTFVMRSRGIQILREGLAWDPEGS